VKGGKVKGSNCVRAVFETKDGCQKAALGWEEGKVHKRVKGGRHCMRRVKVSDSFLMVSEIGGIATR